MFFYPVPFDKITASICPEAKLRKLVKNMVYVGVVAQLLAIDLGVVESGLRRQFAKKQKVFDLNFGAVKAGFDYAQQNLTKRDPFFIERMNETAGKIIIDGNAACGMGAVFAGVTVVAWYPITPSTSVVEATTDLLKKLRVTPEGKATFAVVQAEDELAAIGMVLGAGWAGARAMTATSGPGMSLMAEFCGLGYYAEIPGVIIIVQRTGPSTGMPTRTQQADLLSAAFLSHGDTKHIILLPGSVKECFELTQAAFDLAERMQTPVFVLTDLDLGMNNWMSRALRLSRQAAGPRQGAHRRGSGAAGRLCPLSRCGRRRHRLAHAARNAPPQGLLLHPRLGTQRRGRLHREPGRVPGGDGPAGAQVREGAQAGSRSGHGQERRLEDRLPGLRLHRLRAARKPRPDQAALRQGGGLSAHPGLALRARRFTTLWPRTSAFMWSSRTATRSWPACSSSIFPPTRWPSCAAFSTTTDCRWTPNPSPKNLPVKEGL